MSDQKFPEVTFKYYIGENDDDIYRVVHAFEMASVLWGIDQLCRNKLKYEAMDEKMSEFCENIRSMIHEEINLDRLYK